MPVTNSFNLGNDVKLVFIGSYGRLDMSHVTGWHSSPIIKTQTCSRLNDAPLQRKIPAGWTFGFEVSRANVNLDAYQARQELDFWNWTAIASATLYAYINELDGSTSTWQYTECATELKDAGKWHQENEVKQMFEGFASKRLQVG